LTAICADSLTAVRLQWSQIIVYDTFVTISSTDTTRHFRHSVAEIHLRDTTAAVSTALVASHSAETTQTTPIAPLTGSKKKKGVASLCAASLMVVAIFLFVFFIKNRCFKK